LDAPGTISSACLRSGPVRKSELRGGRAGAKLLDVAERVIDRDEVVALLFNVADIAAAALEIERLLGEGEDDGEEEADEG
jgi:hypothetical protein